MLRQKSICPVHTPTKPDAAEESLSILYAQLPDGRMAPITPGGLVELALSELGACLVDVKEEDNTHLLFDLN